MGRISKLEIQLSHDIDEHYHYNPGEEIRGNILLGLTDVFHLKTLVVTVTGTGSVAWSDGEEKDKHYQAQENYVDEPRTVAPGPGYGVMELSPGVHDFPFCYELPTGLPSSFIGKFGSVTYVLKVSVKEDTKYGISSILTSEPFLILNRKDLSSFLNNKSISEKVERRLWSKSLRNGKITAILTTEKSVYAPGEDIRMSAEILNRSPKLIQGLTALLLMHTTFSAQNHKHSHIQVVSKRRDNWQLACGEGRRWKDAVITIPTYAPESRLDGCDIIDIKYELILRVETHEKHEIRIAIPITICPTENTKLGNGEMARNYGETYKSHHTNHMTLDRATLQKIPLDRLLEFQCDDDDEFGYDRPINDGTLRINPLYQKGTDAAINSENEDTSF